MVDYTHVINEISSLLFKVILEREPDFRSKAHQHYLRTLQAVALGRLAGSALAYRLVEYSGNPGS